MTQKDSQTRNIGAYKFEVFKLPPFDAQDVLIDIGHILAPALGKAATAIGSMSVESALDMDVDDPRISTGIAALMQGVTKEKMRELINTMAKVTHCNGQPLVRTMDEVFRGDLPLMYQWLWFAMEVNFKNFTDWLGTAITGVTGMVKAAQSQSTSKNTGP